ncbi:MAG TPA: ketopantoate reductase family protein [Stellaceae bacterium]|nr:ketopantoate reductase family protein [Stellaceae bacterium]
MRILVLGAGAIGGYFGGRLAEAGSDVTFLVRGRRKQELDANGLVVKSVAGDIALRPKTIAAGERAGPYDIVLLSCKSYDLDAAIAAVAPLMGPGSAVVPMLNGLAHIDRLAEALGRGRVMGGAAYISAALEPGGTVRHVGDMHTLAFGELTGETSARAQGLAAEFARTKAKAMLSPDIVQAMWEKLVMLAALAAATTLTRATIGEIMAVPEGEAFTTAALAECAASAASEGHAPSAAALANYRTMLTLRGSPFAASTMRDLAAGRRTEGDHIVGDLVRRAHRNGVAVPLLDIALLNLAVHEAKVASSK